MSPIEFKYDFATEKFLQYNRNFFISSQTWFAEHFQLNTSLTDAFYESSVPIVSSDFDGNNKTDIIRYFNRRRWADFMWNTPSENSLFYEYASDIEDKSFYDIYKLNSYYPIEKISTINYLKKINLTNSKIMPQSGWCVVSNDFLNNSIKFTTYSKSLNGTNFEFEKEFNYSNDCQSIFGEQTKPFYDYLFGDFNGDKFTDVIAINRNNYFYNKSHKYTPQVSCSSVFGLSGATFFIDLNSNSSSDFNNYSGNIGNCLDVSKIATTSEYVTSETHIYTDVYAADVNGDGKTDIIHSLIDATDHYNPVHRIEVFTLNENNILQSIGVTILDQAYPRIIIGDFNGDGKSDILGSKHGVLERQVYPPDHNNYYVWQVDKFIFSNNTDFEGSTLFVGDCNNDGKSDLLHYYISPYPNNNLKYVKYNCNLLSYSNTNVNGFSDLGVIPLSYNLVFNNEENNLALGYLYSNSLSILEIGSDLNSEKLLKEIDNGYFIQKINYSKLNNSEVYTSDNSGIFYPYIALENNSNINLVSSIETNSLNYNKRQKFKYHNYIVSHNNGSIGFQATTTTNWFTQTAEIISTVNKYDFTKNGANTETFSMLGLIEPNYNLLSTDSFIARTLNTYNHEDTGYVNPLQSNKVFKLFKTKTQSFNGLTGTSSITNVNYNNYNNPINSTTVIKNGATIEKTTTNTFNYDAAISTPYIVDRLNSKTSSTTVQPSGDVHTSEEQYVYDLNLLKQIKKRTTNSGQTSDFITESNEYDSYGNLVQKKFTAPGMADRVTNYEYDTQTHRFITKKIDTELQETVYEYNQNTGLLLSETAPSISGYPLKTTYTYDKWGKVTKITDYLGKLSNVSYSNLVNNSGILKTVTNSDGSSTKTITDVYGRVLHEGYKTIEKKWSVKSTLYNIYDQPIKVTANYFDGDNAEVWNEMQYDIYGRLTQSNHLKTASSPGKVTTYNYNGLTTIENDGLKTTTSIKNAIGQVISLEDSPGEMVTYQYFANGNLKKAITSGSTIEIQQDAYGRKKTLIDPSAGTRNYEYNKFGELTKEEIIGKGFTEFILDNTGKLLEKKITEAGTLKSKATYSYNGNKQLATIAFNDYENSNTINYSYNYDNYKRLNFKDESGYQSYFQQAISYDAFGRPEKQLYTAVNTADGKSSSKWIKTEYKNGFSWKMYDMLDSSTPGVLLWETKEVNENGDITAATLNNNALLLNKTFDVYGFPTQIKYSNDLSDYMVQDTEFDPVYGNLTKRTSNLFGATWTEDLSYDSLDRLTTWKDNEGIQNQSYNGNGSINSNKIGSYAYTIANKPFQTSTITPQYPSAVFDYYANREQNITYNINKKPVKITELNAENIDFEYNPMDSRSVMYYGNLEANKNDRIFRKYYSADGSMEIKRNLNTNQVEFITYVQGSPYNSSMVLKSDGTIQEYLYLLKDYQGTINGVVNTTGTLIEKRQFDVWGSLINFTNASGVTTVPTTANSMVLDRGYTGHEHLLGVNIINMNGRIYDHNLHKFLQPDNNIQDFYNTQNYNRYGYVLNNPTKYTDESGEFWQYIAAAIFNAYAAGYQSSGDYNPFNWDSTAWTNAGLGAASFGASTAATYYADNYISNYGNNNVEFTSQDNYEGNNYSNIDTNFGFANNEVSIWDDSQEIFGNSIQDPINFSGGKYNGFSPFTIPDKNNFNGFTLEYRKTTQLSHIESYNLFSNVFDKRTSMFDKIMSYTDKTGYIPGLNFKSLKSDLKNLNPYKLSAQALIEYSKWKIADVSSQNEQIFKNYIGLHLNNPSNLKGMYQVYERNGYTIYEDVTVYYYDVSTGKYLGKVD